MKRFFSLLLAFCLFCLCGCGAAAPAAETPSPAPLEAPADEAAELTPILAEIRERMHPGTAGSSLTAAQLAVLLLDWSMQTAADETQIRAAAEKFLTELDDGARSEFAEQMGAVQGAAGRLLGEEGEALMEDIGGTEGTLWPWTDAPAEKLEAVFAALK